MTVSLDLLKAQLNIVGIDDDALLAHKIGAAEAWLAGYIGMPLSDFDPLPADLTETVLQLAAYWFEQREAASFGVSTSEVPFGVIDLARSYRVGASAMASNGLKETLAAIDRAARAPREAVKPALMKSANEIAAAQKALAPVLTGDLRDSITVTGPGETTPPYSQPGGSRTAGETEVIITAGNSDVRYAHLPEYGTSKMEASPYFWPAYRLLKTRSQRRISRAMRKAIREAYSK